MSPFDALIAGQVKTAFVPSLPTALGELAAWAAAAGGARRLITRAHAIVPEVRALLPDLVACLAEAALALWPRWYGETLGGGSASDQGCEALLADTEARRRLGRWRRDWSATWFRAAAALCRQGRPPAPVGYSLAVQAAQLALALHPRDVIAAVAVWDAAAPADRLLGLARAAEWLADAADARVLVLAPLALRHAPALDAINHDPLAWPEAPPVDQAPGPAALPAEQKFRLQPIIGRPHPYSPGEQLLARHVAADAELAPLFEFNQWARSCFGRSFLIDLLWAAGRVAVEIDGYSHHAAPAVFASDRQRDYELLLTGYCVLRLPHDEVVADPAGALEKIRRVTRYRRETGPIKISAGDLAGSGPAETPAGQDLSGGEEPASPRARHFPGEGP